MIITRKVFHQAMFSSRLLNSISGTIEINEVRLIVRATAFVRGGNTNVPILSVPRE
jgi:hypothetical protein